MYAENKKKGDITEINCIAAFINLGYHVLIPFGDCERYDFVADVDGKLLKIQCKTARSYDEGQSFAFRVCSMKKLADNKYKTVKYDKYEIDFFATIFNGKCYLIPIEECGSASKRLRTSQPMNNQVNGINWATDYELEKMLEKIKNKVA